MAASNTIKIKTETESLLYKYYNEEKVQRENLQLLVQDLQAELKKLRQELKIVQEQKYSEQENKQTEKVDYETDEEELARETEWVRHITRKKRKLNASLTPPPQNSKTNDQANQEKPAKVKKIPPPPPIVVENIKDYQKFFDFLAASLEKDSFSIRMLMGDSVKINAYNENSYRAATNLLKEQNLLWHSYENKQDRPIRVMVKNLHYTCLPERIVEDLAAKGFKIQEAVNKLSWRKKEPLNMFMLSFQKEEDINKIYEIKTIMGCRVDVQPLKTLKMIPQCKRCQAYGHTQKYCSKEPRCVKCTGKHLTKDCRKKAEEKPKCIHCGEAHPANYRGCIVAKELQALRNKNTKKKTPVASSSTQTTMKTPSVKVNTLSQVNKNVSFAQATRGLTMPQVQATSVNPNADAKLNKILALLSSFDERLKKLESSNNIAIDKPRQ